MTLRKKVSLWMLCVALGACSGAKKHGGDASDDEGDAGEVIADDHTARGKRLAE